MNEQEMTRLNVTLDASTIATVKRVAWDRRLGPKGFSAALRIVVQEWERFSQVLVRAQAVPFEEIDHALDR